MIICFWNDRASKRMKKYSVLILAAVAAIMCVSCKPKYQSPLDDPMKNTIAADSAYELDFTQLNNDVIDNYKEDNPFEFVKDVEIDGSNDTKIVEVKVEVMDDISPDAVDLFMSDLLKTLDTNANVQDSRFAAPEDKSFGGLYKVYNLKYTVKDSTKEIYNKEIKAGEEIPFDASASLENYFETQQDNETVEATESAAEAK